MEKSGKGSTSGSSGGDKQGEGRAAGAVGDEQSTPTATSPARGQVPEARMEEPQPEQADAQQLQPPQGSSSSGGGGGDKQGEGRTAGTVGDEQSTSTATRPGQVPEARREEPEPEQADAQQLQPPQLLMCFGQNACPDRYIQLMDYCVEALDLSSAKLRPVFRFSDHEYFDVVAHLDVRLRGADADVAPVITDSVVDCGWMELCYSRFWETPQIIVHASLDGYLLVSFHTQLLQLQGPQLQRWHVINPATRQWAFVPNLSDYAVIGFYRHATSDEYRVLCIKGLWLQRDEEGLYVEGDENLANYGVLTVSSEELRFIGRPISSSAPKDHGLGLGVEVAYIAPPIQFKANQRLHWPPQESQAYQILVFDTEKEEFSWKKPPRRKAKDMRLLEFPNGKLGLSLSTKNVAMTELWRLDDYEAESWVPVYQIRLRVMELPVPPSMPPSEDFWMIPAVVSPEGDVLIECPRLLLHCNKNGKLLETFQFRKGSLALPVRHVLRESLVQHRMFDAPKPAGATEPPFFHWLCT